MKRITLVIALLLSLASFSQRSQSRADDWKVAVGFNAINSLGTKSPINSPDDWNFRFPLALAAERNWSDNFSVELSLTFNGVEEGKRSDPGPAQDDYNYFAIDTHAKYYFGEFIFPNTDWLDFYANAGVGLFSIDETNMSINVGGGVLFWLNRFRTFGIRAQVLGKFAFNNPDDKFNNNHYQYALQAVFRL